MSEVSEGDYEVQTYRDYPRGPVVKTAFPTRGLSSIRGQGTRSHMPQLRPGSQMNKIVFLKITRRKLSFGKGHLRKTYS